MTKREFVQQTAEKLIAQGGFSTSETGGCYYRNKSGNKCAIGVWIPDELYNESLEGKWVGSKSPEMNSVMDFLFDLVPGANVDFFGEVQSGLHDIPAKEGRTQPLPVAEAMELFTDEELD